MPWKDMGVDYVIESTGLFVEADKARGHIDAGAKKVIMFAPGKGAWRTLIIGVNHTEYDKEANHSVPSASDQGRQRVHSEAAHCCDDADEEDHPWLVYAAATATTAARG